MRILILLIFCSCVQQSQTKIYKGRIDNRDFTIVFNNSSEKSDTIETNTYYYFDDNNEYNELPVNLISGKNGQLKAAIENDDFNISGTLDNDEFCGEYDYKGNKESFCLKAFTKYQFEESQKKEKYSMQSDDQNIEVFDYTGTISIFKNKNERNAVLKAGFPEVYQNNESLAAFQNEMYQESLNEVVQDLDSNMIREDFFNPYQLYSTFEPARVDSKYVIFSNEAYYFTGGAHGNSALPFVNYNVSENRVIQFQDIFSENQLPELEQLLQKKIREQYNIPLGQSLKSSASEDNCFIADDITVTKNIYIGKQGITFVYNPYEITAYACGNFYLTIDWKDLSAISDFQY